MPSVPLSGLVDSNFSFDWRQIVKVTTDYALIPQKRLESEKDDLGKEKKAISDIEAKITALQTSLTALKESSLFSGRTQSLKGNPTSPKMSASANNGAREGSYTFNVTQLATASVRAGQTGIGQRISSSNDVSGVTLATMNTSSAITAGSFTINNKQITVDTTDSLQDVFDAISTATSGSVTAAYDSTEDKITLSSSSGITVGSAGDTSNFLQASKLFTNGTGSVSSLYSLGSVALSSNIADSKLGVSVNSGTFTVNGSTVTISDGDSLDDIFSAISTATSSAVTASYNPSTQKIELASGSPITLGASGDTSNFLSAAKLSANGLGSVESSTTLGSLTTSTAVNTYHMTPGLNLSIDAGDFTINGSTVSILGTDTLDDIFNKISTATSGDVTASYDSSTKKISLSSDSAITLGDASDTSNFLTIAMLEANETGSVSSGGSMGSLSTSTAIDSLNLTGGHFTINGKKIYYDTASDSLNNIMNRVNTAQAGVNLSYDSIENKFSITNKEEGNLGISVDDKEGALLEAMGLNLGSNLTLGENALFSVNGGPTITSTSNTLSDSSHGITGLKVTPSELGSETIEVKGDASNAKSKIQDFITKYNELQSLIKINTSTSTDSKGKVTTSTLTGNREVDALAKDLRNNAFANVAGLDGNIKRLADIGIDFKKESQELEIKDATKLDNALKDNAEVLTEFFTDSTHGFAKVLDNLVSNYTDTTNGIFKAQKTSIDNKVKRIDLNIETIERQVKQQEELLVSRFLALEKVQTRSQQQINMLSRNLPKVNSGK